MTYKQRNVRIFISSTFSDMMSEREHLMKIIFPELRRRCKSKFVELTEVDLRWGIPEEVSKEGKVIEICLNEIDKSRPYFIGILGNRYGWVPGEDSLLMNGQLPDKYQWAKDDLEQGLSITEMEIQYGVLRNRDMDGNAFFYFKEAAELIEQDKSAQEKLGLLKEKIRKDGKYPVRSYNAIEALGEYILADLWNQLEKDFPEEDIPDPHAQEKLNHLGVMASQNRFFIDFDNKASELESTLATSAKVLVFSPKGLGKSALLAQFAQHGFDGGTVIFYAVGAGNQSTKLAHLAGFIAQELKQKYDISYQIPQKIENPGDLLSAFINAVPLKEKLLLIIDGADQLVADSHNQRMQWLPDSFTENVKFIISTSSATQKELLKNRDFEEITLNPAGPVAIRELTVNYLGIYSKQLPAKQLDLISNFRLAGNPLILFTLLNELRIFGVHEKLEEHIGSYTSNLNNHDFFAAFLQRLENDYGQADFRLIDILTSIYLANNGLTESEIVEINNVAKLRWSQINNALDYHLINKSGKLSFANQFLGEAIEKRYLSSENRLKAQLKPLSDYFLDRFDSLTVENSAAELPRLMEELPELALKSGDVEVLKKVIVNMPALLELFDKRNEELPHYLSVLKTQFKLPEIFAQAVDAFLNENVDPGLKAKACFITGHLLSVHDAPESAIPLLNKVLELFNQTRIKSPYVFEALKELAVIYNQIGNYEAAAYILENLLPYQQDENISEILDLLSQQYRNSGNQAIAELLIQDTIAFVSDRFGKKSLRVAIQYNNLGRLYDVGKNFELAEKNYAIAAQIVFDTLGPEHSLYQKIQSNTGILLMNNHRLDEARQVFENVLKIRQSLYGNQHRLTLKTLNSLGVCHTLKGNYTTALELLNQALEGQQQLLGEKHNDTLITVSNIAEVYQKEGRLEEAEQLLKVVLERTIEQYGEVHEQTINAGLGLAGVLTESGKTGEAIELYKFLINIQQSFYGKDHPWVRLSAFKLASLKLQTPGWNKEDIDNYLNWKLFKATQCTDNKDIRSAELIYLEIEEVINKLLNGNHPAIFEAMDNLAGIYHRTLEYEKAAHYCRRISDIGTEVYGKDHPATLEYKVLENFNLFRAGFYEQAYDGLVAAGGYHEKLMNFPKGYITNMYREMLGYFYEFGQTQEKYQAEKEKFNDIYTRTEGLIGQAMEYYQKSDNARALALLDNAIEMANILNNDYGEPFIKAFNYKAAVLLQNEDFEGAFTTYTEGIAHLTKWCSELDARAFHPYKSAGDALLNLRQPERAQEYLTLAQKVNRRKEGFPDAETLDLNISQVSCYLDSDKFEQAFQLINESIPLSEKISGPDHETTRWFKDLMNEMTNQN